MLIRLYSSHMDPSNANTANSGHTSKAAPLKLNDEEHSGGRSNGHPRGAGAAAERDRQARDVQEFELEGLMSEDGDDEAESSSDGAARGKLLGRGR